MVDPADSDELELEPLGSSTVVVGHGASTQQGLELARFISQRRYRVESFRASADEAEEKIQQWVTNSAAEPKMFFLLVSQDDVDEGDRAWVRSGVFAQARKLLSAFGKGRVILIVESGIFDFDYKSGLDDVLYASGKLASTYKSIAAFLLREFPSEGGAGPGRGRTVVKKRTPREPLETDVKIAAALLSVAAVLGAIYIFRSFSGDTAVQAVPDISGVQLTVPTTAQLASPETSFLTPSTPVTTGEAPSTLAPAGPSIPLLPAACRINLARGVSLPAVIYCDTGGGLRVTGYGGPWHNSIARLGLESQVSVALTYEGNGETISLGAGVTNLDPSKAQFGVQSVLLEFSADGKKVQFEEFGSIGRVITFTFDSTLTRP